MTAPLYEARIYIDGEFRPMTDRTVDVTDKSTGEIIGRASIASENDVNEAVAAARRAQPAWAAWSGIDRAKALRAFADHLISRTDELVTLIARETGGTKEKAEDELWAATNQLYNSASQAQDACGEMLSPYKQGKLSMTRRVPLGVIGVITPWNYPLSLAMRAVSPGITFGNTIVLKPAGLTPILGGQILAEAAHAAGIPAGVINIVPGSGSITGQALTDNPDIDVINFTGSDTVGKSIAQHAATAHIVTQLETGGDNAFVVLDDADVEAAATCGVWTSLWFQGQTCISAGRHIVMRAVADQYTKAVVDRVERLRVGNPATDDVDLGPLISESQRDDVHVKLVEPSIAMGAKLLTGGTYEGTFYRPAVLADVTPDMPIFTEETFGPVIPITVVDTIEEALELTNAHRMLMSSVWGGDVLRTLAFAEKVNAGEVHVNDGYARHGGENQAAGFTKRQWIGVQRTPAEYPAWAGPTATEA